MRTDIYKSTISYKDTYEKKEYYLIMENNNKMNTYKTTFGYGNIEYKMTNQMAKELLRTRKGTDANMHPQVFLCKYVNEQLGIKGNCVRVLTDL